MVEIDDFMAVDDASLASAFKFARPASESGESCLLIVC